MAHAFDGRALGLLLPDLDTLIARARRQEEGLAQVARAADEGAVPADDLLDAVRGLSASAREHRQRLQALRRSLAGSAVPSDRPRPIILVVNDAGDDRELTASVLETAGVDVLTATNGLEAVLVASYAQPALVLMDVNMPLLDGIEAARLLKTHPATQHLTLVAHTAWPQYYDGPLKRLFDAVLSKPTSPPDLIAAVRRMIEDESAPPAAAAVGGAF
jgi:two-component system cell cycle response regulator DivK